MNKVAFLPFVLLCLGACSTGESVKQWKRPGTVGPAAQQPVAVVVAAQVPSAREAYENAIVSELRKRGVAAETTFGKISLSGAGRDRAGSAAKLAPAKSILVVRPATALSMNAYTISPTNDGSALAPWENWFEFFTAKEAFVSGPVDPNSTKEIGIHAVLFASPSGRLEWTATTVRPAAKAGANAETAACSLVALMASAGLLGR